MEEQTLGFKLMRTINPAAKKPEKQEISQTTPKRSKTAPRRGWGGGIAFRHSLGGFGKSEIPACPQLRAVRALGTGSELLVGPR